MDDTNEKIAYVASLPKDAFLNGDFTSKCKTTLAMRCTKQVAGLEAYAQGRGYYPLQHHHLKDGCTPQGLSAKCS